MSTERSSAFEVAIHYFQGHIGRNMS